MMYNYYRQECPPATFLYIIKPGDNFYRLAARFNTTVSAIISANPLVNPNALQIGQTICIPRQAIYPSCPEGNYYTIVPGDTLYNIARSYNVSLDDLIEANPGIDPYRIMVGQVICIPLAVPPVKCTKGKPYTIKPGDTFYRLSRRFNVSLDDLVKINPRIDPDRLLVGQTICIPTPTVCPEGADTYIVKSGDTLYKIAEELNTTIESIINLNPDIDPEALEVGQKICIPEAPEGLPQTKPIKILIEGQVEYNEGTLQKSPQGYYIYVLDNFEFTPEEPGRDVLFFTTNDRFFVRIEMLPSNANIGQLKRNAILELRDIGRPKEIGREEIFDPFFKDSKFFLQASNPTITKNIILKEIGSSLFRFTMFLPHTEAIEGVTPRFYAMLKTIGIL